MLGWCAEAGALAQVQNIAYNAKDATTINQAVYAAKGSGYGFACFTYLMGSIAGITIALYVSPDIASENEKKILVSHFNVDPTSSSDIHHTIKHGAANMEK